MQASPTKVIDYFNGQKQNLIPLFQRPYTWKEANWRILWDDVMVQYELGKSGTHFMGAIVSVPAVSVPVGVNKYLIIDGQQRLTTVSLLLCALRDCLDENPANRIQEVYLTNRYCEVGDTLKFVPTQADRDVYRKIVLDRQIPTEDCLMVNAYHFFKKQLLSGLDADDEPVEPARVMAAVEHCLQVVMINLGEDDDPYLIFESLNFKGEPLTQADLVRNYLLMRFRHSISAGGEQERIYHNFWKPLEETLKGELTEFLRHYSMKDGENIKQGGIYAAIKSRLRNLEAAEQVEAEIRDMQKFGEFYANILGLIPDQNPAIRDRLQNLITLRVTTSYPLLLQLFDARQAQQLSDADLEKCLGLVESFTVRRAICGVPTNALNRLFVQWARDLPVTDQVQWLHNAMGAGTASRRFPKAEEFADAFLKQAQYGRRATRFVLCRLEQSFDHKEAVDLSKVTIEHVLPQTLSPAWKTALGEDAEAIHAKLVGTFGNLTLTGYNPELGNMPFPEKKAKLENTHIELNRWILEQEHWGASEIEDRAKELLARAEQIWYGPA